MKKILDRAKLIQDLALKSACFPDNAHPSDKCFKQLAQRILTMI
jgi:hypothetical protein